MKINWGTGLVIGMTAFVIFILSFVIRISTQDKYDHDLVTENYYEKEMVYQKEIDGAKNTKALSSVISGDKTEKGYQLTFPKEVVTKRKSLGKVELYRPSNKKLDFELPLILSEHHFLIPKEKLVPGRWNIKVTWQQNGKEYFYTDKIIF